jgi:hypothetical protein
MGNLFVIVIRLCHMGLRCCKVRKISLTIVCKIECVNPEQEGTDVL